MKRNKRKQTGYQKKWWKLPRRKDKPKLRKTKILGRSITKNFRELLKETRNRMTTSVRKMNMETDKGKTRKIFQEISKLSKWFQTYIGLINSTMGK